MHLPWSSWLDRLRARLATASNTIAVTTGLRATLANVMPLVVLPHVGLGRQAYAGVLGALATSLVDVGGPYRTRLVGMLAQALLGAGLLWLGGAVANLGWLAAALVAAIGLLVGLIRVTGQGGAALGVNMPIALLVGIQLAAFGRGSESQSWALGYAIGGLWTVLVALAFWGLRPYRRLRQEVASVWESVAALLEIGLSTASNEAAREARERRIAAAHAAVRAALEQSREALGELQVSADGATTAAAQLVALIEAAAGVATCAVSLSEASGQQSTASLKIERELAESCRAIARALLHVRSDSERVMEDSAMAGAAPVALEADVQRLACAHALRHLQDAGEALQILQSLRSSLPDLMRLPVAHHRPRGALIAALRAQATPDSAILRHALRASAIGALGTALLIYFHLPRGIWLPITSLAILQPDYGGTIKRAAQRSIGTVVGAVIASVLLITVRGAAYDAALSLLLFATFLLIRRHYGYGIAFLTPLIILLIGQTSPNPWIDLSERVAYTMAGALLALAGGYLLWPQWERDQLRERLARAIAADGAFLDATLQSLAERGQSAQRLTGLRRHAEMAIGAADAGLQRMLVEPAHPKALFATGFALLVYLHRLCRHAIALAAQAEVASVAAEPLAQLRGALAGMLSELQEVIREQRPAMQWAGGTQIAELVERSSAGLAGTGAPAATLLRYVERDIRGLLDAVGSPRDER